MHNLNKIKIYRNIYFLTKLFSKFALYYLMNGNLEIALTWVPDPKIFRSINPKYQFYDTFDVLKNIKKCSSYFDIWPELTTNGNIHYHCRVHINDKIRWYKSILPALKYKGFVVIKTNINNGWTDYCKKDAETMMNVLDMLIPIKLDHKLFKKTKYKNIVLDDTNNNNILDYFGDHQRVEPGLPDSNSPKLVLI